MKIWRTSDCDKNIERRQAMWHNFYPPSGGRMFVVSDNRSCMHNLRSVINYCQGNRSLVVSLTNLAIKVATDAAREAARAAGHAVATAHIADHELGAAAYAIRAVRAAAPPDKRDEAGRIECQWQREQLPDAIRALVLSGEDIRNHKFWLHFQC